MSDRGKLWLRWGLSLAAFPVMYLLLILFVVTSPEGGAGIWPVRVHFAILAILALLNLAAVLWMIQTVSEIAAVLGLRRHWQTAEPASLDDLNDLDHLDDDDAFGAAGALAKTLLDRQARDITVDNLTPLPGEKFHLTAPIHLEQAAHCEARANRWGEKQRVEIAVSNKRVAFIADGDSQSLEYPRIAGVYPRYRQACLVLETDEDTSLRLTGFAAPQVAVWLEYTTRGRPAIEELRATTFAEPPA